MVLEKALRVFWERGFDGASIQDLVDATGLSRASLYGAFGDKEELFRRTVNLYVDRAAGAFGDLEAAPSARAAIAEIFRRSLDSVACPNSPKGCYALLSATSQSSRSAAGELLTASFTRTESMLQGVLERGVASGELSAALHPVRVARLLAVTLQGLSSAASAGRSRAELEEVAEEALRILG